MASAKGKSKQKLAKTREYYGKRHRLLDLAGTQVNMNRVASALRKGGYTAKVVKHPNTQKVYKIYARRRLKSD